MLFAMAKKQQRISKSFRFRANVCAWLERKSTQTGISQTRLIVDALKATYRMGKDAQDDR